ncbi:hypothetical protein SynBIOSE41_02685 [Synechococcus sp. BIOS-E4-1]|nr:hypothetical protein SynBIOSE41_02685 [Synechococcus sp. BIOS-E4-1]
MKSFSDYIENVSAIEAIELYETQNHILREEFSDMNSYQRKELSMITARRKRKSILDVHWLNFCWQLKDAKQTPSGTWKSCPPEK